MQNTQVLISPYVFPGLKLNGLSKKQFAFLKKAVVTITREEIVNIVLEGCEVTLEQLVSRCRERDIVDARKITCKVLKTKFNYSLKSIGDFIGGRDHTTVIHSITEFDSLYSNNDAFKAKADRILDKVGIEIR
jgi:chromosomal replication initiator protein